MCEEFANLMTNEFEMSLMGELHFFLGLQVTQTNKGCFINQSKYVLELLKRFKMDKLKTIATPMSTSAGLDADERGKMVDAKVYRGMIGSLLYLTASRLNIQFSVCLCVHF